MPTRCNDPEERRVLENDSKIDENSGAGENHSRAEDPRPDEGIRCTVETRADAVSGGEDGIDREECGNREGIKSSFG